MAYVVLLARGPLLGLGPHISRIEPPTFPCTQAEKLAAKKAAAEAAAQPTTAWALDRRGGGRSARCAAAPTARAPAARPRVRRNCTASEVRLLPDEKEGTDESRVVEFRTFADVPETPHQPIATAVFLRGESSAAALSMALGS